MKKKLFLSRLRYGMQFKSHWLLYRRCIVHKTKAESILQSKGFAVIEPGDILRPSIIEEPFETFREVRNVWQENQKKYVFKECFRPLGGLEQCQLLTNSLVFNSLPESILDKVKEPTKEDVEIFKQVILHSQLLNAKQSKLPLELDEINLPVYHPPRTYGINHDDQIASLLHHLSILMIQDSKEKILHPLHNVASRVTLNHSGKLMNLNHTGKLVLCCQTPLKPELNSKDVSTMDGITMPDIFPFSPFINCKEVKDDQRDGFGVSGGYLAPHTVFMSYPQKSFSFAPEQFYGMTLLYAFSHAAAYARELNKDLTGDLKTPVTLNAVHTTGRHFHVGRFQLNTLDCTGPTRNLFWHAPLETMFGKIDFEYAKPMVNDINAKPLSILKALC